MYRKAFRLFLVIALIFAITALVTSCINGGNEDGSDDAFDPTLYLPITSDSKPVVTVVSSYSKTPGYLEAFNSFISRFNSVGIKFTLAYSASEDPDLPEILIGDRINAPSDTYVDPHSLGDSGYAIRVIGNKLVVAGGSEDSLVKAIKLLENSVFNLGDSTTDINNLSVARSTDIYVRQYYAIQSITLGGKDLFGYDIVCDVYDPDLKYCADLLHNVLYDNAGYWLTVKDRSSNPSIRIAYTEDSGEGGFRVFVDGEDLVIACAYPSLMTRAFEEFVYDFLHTNEERAIELTSEVYASDIRVIRYADFGAVGDGLTDDYDAIKEAHRVANVERLTVVAESGKIYNLGQHNTPIIIKTDTVWDGATFIIDDSEVGPKNSARTSAVFSVESDKRARAVLGIKSLEKGQANVGVTFDGPMLLYLVYDGQKQYIRYGNNADNGANQQELILVDSDGNVDPSTPIMWDYPSLTSVTAYSASDKPVILSGGKFITVANAAPREYTYYMRNISISRSNVSVVGLEHYIEGEGDTGAPYNGFISIVNSHNVLVKNTVLTGHKVYKLSSDSTNAMGTYDIAITSSNAVTFLNCRQSNSITDTTYWGIMGSNYCKNLTYDGCVFSRFDAHKGTHNATIINSEIGHQKLSIIGSGTLRVENTIVHGNNLVNLRSDYGSTWDGDMIFKNVTLKNTGTPILINGSWANHYFGYTCYLPKNITIDGVTLAKGTTFYVLPNLKTGIDTDTVSGATNLNKVVLTQRITVIGNPKGYTYEISSNTTLYKNVELVEE